MDFNLPSKKRGDGSICVGKVVADLNTLKCSKAVEFNHASLAGFSDQLKTMYSALKGEVSLKSSYFVGGEWGDYKGISFVTVIFFYILYRLILRCPSCGKFFE